MIYIDNDDIKVAILAILTLIFYAGLLLVEEWAIDTLCRELVRCVH